MFINCRSRERIDMSDAVRWKSLGRFSCRFLYRHQLWADNLTKYSPARKLRCCGAQLSRNCGRFLDFRLQISLIIFHFGEIWGKLGPLSTRNLSFQKFVAVCPKNSTSCLHAYFHSRCHWVMARLMTLQRSLQYSLSLSWTKTLFRKISNFCTSLGLYNIDRRCFVVRCQFSKVPKDQSNILHPKWAKLCATLAQPFHFFAQLLPHV